MRLHHAYFTIPSDGADVLRHFYGDLLGLPEIPKAEVLAAMPLIWFAVGDDHLHFCLDDTWDVGHKDHHVALLFDDLDPVLERLRSAGHEISQAPTFQDYGYTRFYVRDPWNRRVEMITPLVK
jgi:catechol 2,3-dioxygenase-like lactoylglutathione lyase family enzyme